MNLYKDHSHLNPVIHQKIAQVPLAIFDIETTGLSYKRNDEILEISVVRLEPNQKPQLVFDSLLKPQGRVKASHVHKIYSKDVADAPTFKEIAPQLMDALSGAIWIAYNASFDINFLKHAFHKHLQLEVQPAFLCALQLRKILDLGKGGSLSDNCSAFGIPFSDGQHIAVYDTWMTALLMRIWLDRMHDLGLETYADLAARGKNVSLKSLKLPLWHGQVTQDLDQDKITPFINTKSRYAIDLDCDPSVDVNTLPPISQAPRFIYGETYTPQSTQQDVSLGRSTARKHSQQDTVKTNPEYGSTKLDPHGHAKNHSSTVRIDLEYSSNDAVNEDLAPLPFTLRAYQQEAIDSIILHRKNGIKRMVVCLPTGAGKTVIFSKLAAMAHHKVLVLAHREELLTQAKDKLQRALGSHAKVCIEQAGSHATADAKVVVASLRSLHADRLQTLVSQQEFALIIYDECHHAVADDNQRILESLGVFETDFRGTLVGFTATTQRADGIGLDTVFEKIVYSRNLMHMIQDQYLVPLKGYRVSTEESLETIGGRGDFPLHDLAEKVDIQERNDLVARSIQELARDRRTICFCVTVHHAQNLARTLRQIGVPADVIHGDLKSHDRRRVLQEFQRGDLQVITNVGVLTEGFDDPAVSCIAMARPTRSEGLYIQCVGRGMRLSEGKQDCLVLDFVDVSALRLVTLPTLLGMPVAMNFDGEDAVKAASDYHQMIQDYPGFEWQADQITLAELKERALSFDPLSLKLSPEIQAISQNGWVSLGQRGLALHFTKNASSFNELVVLLTSDPGKKRYQVVLDGVEVAREARIESAIEAADWEIGRMGMWAVETSHTYASWRQEKSNADMLDQIPRHLFPRPPQTLEEVFRALTYLKYVCSSAM